MNLLNKVQFAQFCLHKKTAGRHFKTNQKWLYLPGRTGEKMYFICISLKKRSKNFSHFFSFPFSGFLSVVQQDRKETVYRIKYCNEPSRKVASTQQILTNRFAVTLATVGAIALALNSDMLSRRLYSLELCKKPCNSQGFEMCILIAGEEDHLPD